MTDWVWSALGLMLLIEGLLPLLGPGSWRRMFVRVLQFSDGQLRFMGLCSIAAGLVVLLLVRG
jgi:uncharacterized protein YjeT (DUF2065 family)